MTGKGMSVGLFHSVILKHSRNTGTQQVFDRGNNQEVSGKRPRRKRRGFEMN